MKKLLLLFITVPLLIHAQDPNRFREEVLEIQKRNDSLWDANRPVIIFTGSSSVRLWNDLQSRFPEHQILNTGFGGSQFSDLAHYLEVLVLKYNPSRVFIYEGDNDIGDKKSPGSIVKTTIKVVQTIQQARPNLEVVLISPKPSIARWHLRGKYKRLNRKLARFAKDARSVYFADVWHPMLNNRKLNTNLFIDDGLHMNTQGYDIWYDVIKDFVDEAK